MRKIFSGSPKRKDANQNEIAEALERAGCSVLDLSAVPGLVDLLVGRDGRNYLLEVKNPEARGKLNKLQEKFFGWWRGQIDTVETIDEAFKVVGVDYE